MDTALSDSEVPRPRCPRFCVLSKVLRAVRGSAPALSGVPARGHGATRAADRSPGPQASGGGGGGGGPRRAAMPAGAGVVGELPAPEVWRFAGGESSGESEGEGAGAGAAAGGAAGGGGGAPPGPPGVAADRPLGREYEAPFRQRGRANAMRSLRAAAARDERRDREAARARLQAQEAQLSALRLEVDLERQALRQVCTGCLRLRARERKVHAKTVEDLGAMATAGWRKCSSCFAKEAGSAAVERHNRGGRMQDAGGAASEATGREAGTGAPEEVDALDSLRSELQGVDRQVALGMTPEFRARMLDKARELRSEIKRLEQKKKVSLMQQRVAARKAASRKVTRPPSASVSRPHSPGCQVGRSPCAPDFSVQGWAAAPAAHDKTRNKSRAGRRKATPPR